MIRFLTTKIGLSLLFALVVIGGAAVLKAKGPATDEIGSKVGLIADASVQNALKNGELDSSNWEEVLKSITSTSSASETIARLAQSAQTSGLSARPLTATDRFSQEFFKRFVELKESGAPIDENTGIRLVNQLLSEDYGGMPSEKAYTEGDISILNTFSLADLKRYGNNLGLALAAPTPAGYENELIIVNRASEDENSAELEKLAQNIARYEKIRANALAVPVPSALKAAHITLLNSLSAIIEGVKGMKLIASDPVGATKMVVRYEDGLKGLELSTAQTSIYFKRQNISFSSSESGYIFME